jgi:hypothetical protein
MKKKHVHSGGAILSEYTIKLDGHYVFIDEFGSNKFNHVHK